MTGVLELYTSAGFAVQVQESFELVLGLLEAEGTNPDEYLLFWGPDGCRTAVRRKDILGFGELTEADLESC